jgi:hypothetical protein
VTTGLRSNFAQLEAQDVQLLRLGLLAERYFPADPNTSLLKPLAGDHRTALAALKITWQLGVWFHRTFKDPAFKSGPFIPPAAPAAEPYEAADLRAELEIGRPIQAGRGAGPSGARVGAL